MEIIEKSLNTLYDQAVHQLIVHGKEVEVRGTTSKEIHPCLLTLEDATKRTLIFPGRGNNPFATLFETLWVIAGENEIKYLECFLPRAADFSDDGHVWRAGYGKRIFEYGHNKVDQFRAVYEKLSEVDLYSRQAVVMIWNPEEDSTGTSKDFPCSNKLTFLVRDGKLDLTLDIRSNDVLWGFSSINVYEFTVLQEIMANMLGVPVGAYHHFANSLHVYTKGYNAEKNYPKLVSTIFEDKVNNKRLHNGYHVAAQMNFIPTFNFTGRKGKYGTTMGSYIRLYDIICDLTQYDNPGELAVNFSSYIDQELGGINASESKMNIEIISYMYLFLLIKVSDQDYIDGFYMKEHERVMNTLDLTDLQVSAEYWILKKLKKISPLNYEQAINNCTNRKGKMV